MLNKILVIIISVALSACASTHPGKMGQSLAPQNKLPLKMSAQNIDEGSNEPFQLIEVTMENTSENWLKIDKARVIIDNPAESKLSVVLGNDLKDWAQAASLKQKQEEHNREMVQFGLIGVGAVAALAGGYRGDSGLAQTGAAVVVGTYTWAVVDAINASVKSAEQSEKIPDNHLYHAASIPSNMHLRRWVLLNKPIGQVIKSMVIEFETAEGERETYAVSL